MRPVDTLRKIWQAGGRKEMPYSWPTSSLESWWYMPEGHVDTSGVGDGTANSAVFGLLHRKAQSFAEPTVRVFERVDGQDQEVPGHPIEALFARPNPYMVSELLWGYVVAAVDTEGDAYLFKSRSAGGRVVELWPLIPAYVTPQGDDGPLATPADRGKLIAYYEYNPNGVPVRIEPSEVIHIRTSLDPDNHRRGQAALKTVLREVLTDEQAGQFAAALLKNMGVPGVVISPKDPNDPGPSADEAERMAARYKQKFSGSRRGEPYFIRGGPVDVNVVSFTPEQMDLSALRRVPEERFSSVLGVPAILAHLGAGLDRATYSNAATLREMFTEDTLIPLWRVVGSQLTAQLLPDLDSAAGRWVAFDLSQVRALQQDEDRLWERVGRAVVEGWATVADGRRAVGLPVEDHHRVFLRSATTVEIPDTPDGGSSVDAVTQELESVQRELETAGGGQT